MVNWSPHIVEEVKVAPMFVRNLQRQEELKMLQLLMMNAWQFYMMIQIQCNRHRKFAVEKVTVSQHQVYTGVP